MNCKYDFREAGVQNILDGWYIKNTVIPRAYSDKHWNFVVAQTNLAAELLLKGLIRLTLQENEKTHNIDQLLNQFKSLLEDNPEAISKLHIWTLPKDNFYGFELFKYKDHKELWIYIFKCIAGVYTELVSAQIDEKVARNACYTLKREDWTLKLYQDDYLLFSHSDASHASQMPDISYQGASFLPIDDGVISNLSGAVKALSALKHKVELYSEVKQVESDALNHIKHLNDLVEALKPFIGLVETSQ